MPDINYLKENKEKVLKAVKAKKIDVDLEKVLTLDDERREVLRQVEILRAKRNEASEARDIEGGKRIKEELEGLEEQLKQKELELRPLVMQIPNVPLDTVPDGDETNNKILDEVGEKPEFSFTPKDHLELAEKLNIIDMQTASKVSGSRFAYLKNEGVLLELAIVRYAMDYLRKEGFELVIPPALIKQEMTEGLGYWSGGGNDNYYLVSDYQESERGEQNPNPLYLIGTGEHALVPIHAAEILDEKDLPKKYAAFSPCFRREAGTYGKDTRGILRVHQFDKVEMVVFTTPDQDEAERKNMLEISKELMKSLGFSIRTVQLAKGDLGFPSAETIDIETWLPSQNTFRETHSISTTTDFQARRLNIKFKGEKSNQFVHILNGTAFAIGRTIIAILENYQREDGSVKIPDVLIPYTGFSEIIPKNS